MKRSMKSTLVAFSTQRMVKEYAEMAYLKLGVGAAIEVLSTQYLVLKIIHAPHASR